MPASTRDPRYFQIAVLGSLLVFGLLARRLDITAMYAVTIVTTCLVIQYICTKTYRLRTFETKSALISALSLCLLLRTSSTLVVFLGCALAMGSKFVIRTKNKHLFNPTNFAITALLLTSDNAWVSPGQWGSEMFFAGLLGCAGIFVVFRAARSDVTFAFLIFHAGFLFIRSLWLHDPIWVPLHRLESGAVVLFAFFMISDPKTTPNSRIGRIVFALLVAALAYYFRFKMFNPNALFYALTLGTFAVPILDRIFPGDLYDWSTPSRSVRVDSGHVQLSTIGVLAHET